ncbi:MULTISPECIES: hypothetical protein [Bacillus cereus group]|nr:MULTISPECIES: hypothetical protein [Bacillus cereus group]PEQ27691.1 hypothetical protein CN471_29670 [Bacillus thuringiensis]PFT30988.1 hypothetical protein COK71_21040 [Bacillus cereus]
MKSKVLAAALGFGLVTTGFVATSANASTENVSAKYNVSEVQEQESNTGVEPRGGKLKAAGKVLGKVADEVKSWALYDAVFGDAPANTDLDKKDVNVIFDK